MEKAELGRFYAIAWDEASYEFIVNNDNTIDVPELGIKEINKVVISPRFKLVKFAPIPNTIQPLKGKKDLIKNFEINEDLFKYLKENYMIRYSTEMAYLYGFKDKKGFDARYKGHPFKWAEKKGPILVKQRNGEFH